jgi:hypothetical protein
MRKQIGVPGYRLPEMMSAGGGRERESKILFANQPLFLYFNMSS